MVRLYRSIWPLARDVAVALNTALIPRSFVNSSKLLPEKEDPLSQIIRLGTPHLEYVFQE